MSFRQWLWCAFACAVLAACSREPESDPNSCAGLAGNYDLVLSPETYPAESTSFALNLEAKSGLCEAKITPERLPTVSLAAQIDQQVLRLDDSQGPDLPTLTVGWYWGLHFFREYHFKQITLTRGSAAGFSAAEANVEVMWAEDDICMVSDSKWVGSVGADVTAPRLFAGPPSVRPPKRPSESCFYPTGGEARPGLPDDLLPWDVLAVEASEPVAGLASKLSLEQSGTPVASEWRDAPLDESAKASDVWAWTSLAEWDLLRGTTLDVKLGEGLRDAAGHAPVQTSHAVSVLDVGDAKLSHEFDDASTVAIFGDVTIDDGVLRAKATCNSGIGGIAGRLRPENATKLVMTVRVEVGTIVLVDVVGKSGTHYAPSSLPDDDDWFRLEVPLGSETEVGFSVVPNSMCHWTTGATVWIDSIRSE